MKRNSGFTLIEVMVAMLLGAIGLLGTLAVQQAVIGASKLANDAAVALRLASQKLEIAVIGASKLANDAAVALRLASQKLEVFSTVVTTGPPPPGNTTPPNTDQFQSPVAIANAIGDLAWKSTNVAYVNAEGIELTSAPTGAAAAEYRWTRRWRVLNLGPSQPYVISVTVTYNTDTGSPKTVRLDMERRKSW